mmetsp:Transcript_40674/g.128243  ORF Transcript_40674/g.128243 Transcript_40674/m.128243 type:complete len:234 (+) Transcript_40674:687-1388(+)
MLSSCTSKTLCLLASTMQDRATLVPCKCFPFLRSNESSADMPSDLCQSSRFLRIPALGVDFLSDIRRMISLTFSAFSAELSSDSFTVLSRTCGSHVDELETLWTSRKSMGDSAGRSSPLLAPCASFESAAWEDRESAPISVRMDCRLLGGSATSRASSGSSSLLRLTRMRRAECNGSPASPSDILDDERATDGEEMGEGILGTNLRLGVDMVQVGDAGEEAEGRDERGGDRIN